MKIFVRRGGVDIGQSHNQWLSTISQSPNVISMSFVPITSLMNGIRGNGFLSHAVNLYLRCEYASPSVWRSDIKTLILEKHPFKDFDFDTPDSWHQRVAFTFTFTLKVVDFDD